MRNMAKRKRFPVTITNNLQEISMLYIKIMIKYYYKKNPYF